jgi:trans-aconitate methyltransferase
MIAFNFDGEKYRAASGHQKDWGTQVISELQLAGNERILDLGCGDGTLTKMLAECVPQGRVVGIDASWGMIETAKKLEPDRENLFFRLMDIECLNFEYQFDLVFSNATLQWVKDHKRMLQRVYLRLRPNGVLRFNFAGAGNCKYLVTALRETMAEDRFAPWFGTFDWPWYFPTLTEYQSLMSIFEFQDLRLWDENADHHFPSAKELISWIDQPCLVPFLAGLPETLRKLFRNRIVEKMILRTRQNDGTYFETFRRINVFARK